MSKTIAYKKFLADKLKFSPIEKIRIQEHETIMLAQEYAERSLYTKDKDELFKLEAQLNVMTVKLSKMCL